MVLQRLENIAFEERYKSALQATARAFHSKGGFEKTGNAMLLEPVDHKNKSPAGKAAGPGKKKKD